MGQLLLLVLVFAWLVVLAPRVFRRGDERGSASLDMARARLASLHRGNRPNAVHRLALTPPSFSPSAGLGKVGFGTARGLRSAKRRRQVVLTLVLICFGSLIISIATRSLLVLSLHVVADTSLGLFIAMLRRTRSVSYRPSMTSGGQVGRSSAPLASSHGFSNGFPSTNARFGSPDRQPRPAPPVHEWDSAEEPWLHAVNG